MLLVSGMAGKSELQAFQKLVTDGGLADLGPGPRKGILTHAELTKRLDSLLANASQPPVSSELVRALILLWHDDMDPAHNIAQAIENADGSFVHGILHRREPDYGNAAYWFRRVGAHKSFPTLAQRAGELLDGSNAGPLKAELLPNGEWDPYRFIRACEKASKHPDDAQVDLLKKVQAIETEVLLEQFLGT